ncbi:hypothetical protein KIN20_015728 [Parelaphostrongylus tenuis]|uniref:Uncharacterized protein n=1 Tax=Parelaphostrongylus tenuis TaxID=148309 RepID=A0AAD5N4H2_PARTN|nr:hypothetical protein KIN20_015728 [Parelaphostrongylus tenuis]
MHQWRKTDRPVIQEEDETIDGRNELWGGHHMITLTPEYDHLVVGRGVFVKRINQVYSLLAMFYTTRCENCPTAMLEQTMTMDYNREKKR